MYNSLSAFRGNIAGIRELATLHDYLCTNLKSPMNFDDLLRFQIVYSVSALDKLIHDIIRIGMVQIFLGRSTDRQISVGEDFYERICDFDLCHDSS